MTRMRNILVVISGRVVPAEVTPLGLEDVVDPYVFCCCA